MVPPEPVATTHETLDGAYVYRHELTDVGRRLVDNQCIVPVYEARAKTIQEEASLFLLVNGSGVAQDETTMQNAARVAAAE